MGSVPVDPCASGSEAYVRKLEEKYDRLRKKFRRQTRELFDANDEIDYLTERHRSGVRVWITNRGTEGVVLREVIIDGHTFYRLEAGSVLGIKNGESVEGTLIVHNDE